MGDRFGSYELLDELAAGGMGRVFRARLTGAAGFEKIVAIKFMLPKKAMSPASVDMFKDEAKLVSGLSHANIVEILDFGVRGGNYYIVMEYVAGANLRALLSRATRRQEMLTPALAAHIAAQAARGLDFAHKKKDADGKPLGIVHLDVSPHNVVVSWTGETKILDFGIAQSRMRTADMDPTVVRGKFAYMSPEQAIGDEVDHRSDLFSLGSILYEMLTGRRAFPQPGMSAALKVSRAELIRPERLKPDIPGPLVAVVLRAMARNPNDRYQSASEMVQDLTLWLAQSRTRTTGREDEQTALATWAAKLRREPGTSDDRDLTFSDIDIDDSPPSNPEEETAAAAELSQLVAERRQLAPSGLRGETTLRQRLLLVGSGLAVGVALIAGSAYLIAGTAVPPATPTPTPLAIAPTPATTAPLAATPEVTATAIAETAVFATPKKRRIGFLKISSVPAAATLFLDGTEVDKTPVLLPDLAVPESYVVRVKKEGFSPWAREVDLVDDLPVEVLAHLDRSEEGQLPGSVTLEIPDGVFVVFDGAPHGPGPLTVKVEAVAGKHQVRLKDSERRVYKEFMVDVSPGQSVEPTLPPAS